MADYHAYGWTQSPPDSRDVMFAPRPEVVALLPPRFSLVNPSPGQPFDPPLNQGSLGSCGPHSEAKNLIFDDLKTLGAAKIPSRLFLYYTTRMLMGTVGTDSGVENRTMLKALAQYGWCDEELWPYDTSRFTDKPPQAAFDQAAQRAGLLKYEAVQQNLDTIKACLYQTGRPVIIGWKVFQNLELPQVDATGDVPMPAGAQVGGHDTLAVGWDDSAQTVTFQNHWYISAGKPWGNHGYGRLPYKYLLDPSLAGDFWTVKAGLSPSPTPTPPAPPAPSPTPSPAGAIGLRLMSADGKRTLKPTGWADAGPWPPTS